MIDYNGMPFFIDPTVFAFLIPLIVWIPFVELGVGIPFALVVSGLPAWQVGLLAFAGHATGVIIFGNFIYRFLPTVEGRYAFVKRFVNKTRTVRLDRFLGRKEVGILAMMTLPLPLAGMWPALTAAFVFGVPKRNAILTGVIGSAIATMEFTFVAKLVIEFIKRLLETFF